MSTMQDPTDPKNHVERLIKRVRTMIDMGLSIEEILEACKDEKYIGEVYLAYHAAMILIADSNVDVEASEA